ncbi:MAG: type II toxin-antitoxin system prevent-host-death family antitoxin [Lachnospiraceae bacterium]|nr:type II toxin-antitoxin system prevent-host-death family antitoxin [Lachnospiraceae bacterium]
MGFAYNYYFQKEPIFITKNGYGDLVVMSIETYEQIVETQLIDNAISEAEEEKIKSA